MFKSIRCAAGLFAALFSVASAPALATNIVADVDHIAGVLERAGYAPELGTNAGERSITAQANGYKFLVLPLGCDDSRSNCRSVQFFISFNPQSSPSLEALNSYARDNRWGRVYLDKDGDPALEFDLDLERGGMSEELFLDNLAYWEATVDSYAKFVFGS